MVRRIEASDYYQGGAMNGRLPPNYRALRVTVYERDRGICWLCGWPVSWSDYQLEHVVPMSSGWVDWGLHNLRASHAKCNRAKWGSRGVMPPANVDPRW